MGKRFLPREKFQLTGVVFGEGFLFGGFGIRFDDDPLQSATLAILDGLNGTGHRRAEVQVQQLLTAEKRCAALYRVTLGHAQLRFQTLKFLIYRYLR